mmetsp:Transcript_93612/g.302988  ORF Transcript_93612/g.302988 Transcript_93612/m.302988 type:complete len:209 (+) Transcript_93612:2208-2834(+)
MQMARAAWTSLTWSSAACLIARLTRRRSCCRSSGDGVSSATSMSTRSRRCCAAWRSAAASSARACRGCSRTAAHPSRRRSWTISRCCPMPVHCPWTICCRTRLFARSIASSYTSASTMTCRRSCCCTCRGTSWRPPWTTSRPWSSGTLRSLGPPCCSWAASATRTSSRPPCSTPRRSLAAASRRTLHPSRKACRTEFGATTKVCGWCR